MSTRLSLPAPVAAYIAASNAHDARAAAAAFAPDAIVRDEGRDHAGAEAILAWKADVTAKYHAHVEPLSFETTPAGGILTGKVSGDFPGSPIDLRYAFELAGGKIVRLGIAP